jgi:2-methylcitrate dehydratase PrpD
VSGYLDRLAAVAAGLRLDALPDSTVGAARRVLLDTLGAILGGSVLPDNRRLAEFAAGRSEAARGSRTGRPTSARASSRPRLRRRPDARRARRVAPRPAGRAGATLLGHHGRGDAFWAALVNATAGVALEVDEGNRLGGGHPAIHTLPGALAVAEERALGGRRLLEALVAGYEIGSRLGTATTPRPNVHSHGTWGTIATAVAVARLADAPAAAMREVINLAASMSPANSWTPALEGATVRNLYPGRSAWQGILAVDVRACGFTGLGDGPSDVYGTMLGDRFEPDLAVAGLDRLGRDEGYRIERNYFKLHACCRYNHFALDAVLGLRRAHGLAPDEVAGVEVTTVPFTARMADPAPASTLAAKFSVPYAVAAAVVLGRTDPPAFVPPALTDPRIRDLARRVAVKTDAAMSPRDNDRPTARVRIALRDGRTLESTIGVVHGDAEDPPTAEELTAKFVALAEPVIGDRRSRRAIELVEEVERLKDIRELTASLVPV